MADEKRNLVLSISANTRAAVAGMERFIKSLRETDGATGRANRALVQARQALAQYVSQVQQGAARIAQSMRQQLAAGTERAVSQAKKAIQSLAPVAERSFAAVRLAAEGTKIAISGMLGPLGSVLNVGKTLGVVFGGGVVAGLGAVANVGVDMISTLKSAENTLASILGNRGMAAKFVKALEQEAAASLPTFKDLLPAAVQLAQVYGPQGLGKVIPTIRAFGDAAVVAAGGDTEALSRALAQFRQLITRDNPTMEDLGLIGENLGVNVRSIIKEAFGTADMETLGKAGVTGMMIGDALVAGFAKKFGGAQKTGATGSIGGLMSGISDAFNSISAQVSGGLYDSIMKTLKGFLDFIGGIQKSESGKQALKTIEVLLTGVGRALELAAKQAQPFLDWLSKVAKADNVVLFLTNVLALIQTVGQTVLQLFGVDLQKAMDPKNVTGWFGALGEAAANAINIGFGLGRVFQESGRMIQSAIQDVGDHLRDFAKDAEYVFKSMLLNVQASIYSISISILASVEAILEGLNRFKWLNGQSIFNFDTGAVLDARLRVEGRRDRSLEEAGKLNKENFEDRQFRAKRDAERKKEDPFRDQAPGARLYGAFMGIGRDTSPQERFWEQFSQNRMGIAKGFFAGATAEPPADPARGGPQLYGATPHGPSQVTRRYLGIPTPPGLPMAPQAPAAPAGDPFAPIRLPDGRVVSQFAPEAQGVGRGANSGVQVQQAAGADGARTINLTFYPQNFQQVRQMILQVLDEEERKSNPGVSTGY